MCDESLFVCGIGYSYRIGTLVANHSLHIGLVHRLVANDGAIDEMYAGTVGRHDAVVLERSEVVDKREWSTCGDEYFHSFLTHLMYSLKGRSGYGVRVERYESAVDVEEYGFQFWTGLRWEQNYWSEN